MAKNRPSEKGKGREMERGENVQCHWDQTTIALLHLPRKTAIASNTEGERGRAREKRTGRDGKRGGGKVDGEKLKQRDKGKK